MTLWEKYDEIDIELKEKCYTIPPYPCISVKEIENLLNCLKIPDSYSGGLEGEILRIVRNPWQRAYQVEYRYKPSKIFYDFLVVIESATYDLMIGNNVCSYISLVPVVESVLRKWVEYCPQIVENKKAENLNIKEISPYIIKYLVERNLNRASNLRFQSWIEKQINYLKFMLESVFFLNFQSSEYGVKREFNRNRILHLLDDVKDNVVLRDNNTRIFLLLDIIAELFLSLDDELYSKNTFYADVESNIDFNLRWKIYLKNAMEAIDFTDINILRFAFFDEDKETTLDNDRKQYFLAQKNTQIELISNLKLRNMNSN